MPPSMTPRAGRTSGLTALLLFVLYLANVLQGKARLLFDWQPLFQLGDTMEFLLLLACAVCFTVSILRREAQTPDRSEEEEMHDPSNA